MSCPSTYLQDSLDILAATSYIPSPNAYWIYLLVDVFELICMVFSVFVVTFGFSVFYQVPIFHKHLIRLFCGVAIIYYLIIAFRILPILIYLFWYAYPISTKLYIFSCVPWIATVEKIRFGLMGCYACCLKCIVIERFLAIFNLSTYEQHTYAWFTILGVLAQIIIGMLAFGVLYYDLINIMIVVSLAALANIICCLFFTVAQKINNHLYNLASKTNSGYTLSQRYQMVENIRTTHILKKALCVCFFLNLAMEVYTFCNNLVPNKILQQAALIAFNYTIVVYSISFVYIALSGNEIWRREAIARLRKIRKKFLCFNRIDKSPTTGSRETHHVLRNVRGHQMNFRTSEEGDQHFKSLHQLWDSHFKEPV